MSKVWITSPALLGALLASLAPSPASAQAGNVAFGNQRPTRGQIQGLHIPGSMGIPQPEPAITLSIKNRSLGRVLADMFKQTRYRYRILGQIGNQLYSLECTRMPLSRALTTVLAQDKSPEPLVWSFNRTLTGGGEFVVDREFIDINRIEGENRVSVANGRITKVLPKIFDQMKVPYRIEPDVPPVLVSVQLRPNDWSQALPQVVLEANKHEQNLTYSLDGETYVVHIHKTPALPPGLNQAQAAALKRVKVSAGNLPFKEVLGQIFQGSRWKYQVSDAVKDFTVSYTTAGETEIGALQAVLKESAERGYQITYREGKGVLFIEPGPLPGEAKVSAKGGISAEPTTSLVLTDRLSKLVPILAGALMADVRIAKNVPDLPVMLKVQDASIEQALEALIASARESIPAIMVRRQGDIYHIELAGMN